MSLLRLSGVGRRFGAAPGRFVLRGLEIAVGEGEFLCLVGPSGCGKTTLLRLLAGLDTPDEGRREPAGRRKLRLAALFQEPRLVPWLSVLDNLRLVDRRPADFEARAAALLAAVELPEVGEVFPGQLSGGMQRRIALIRALLVEPELLLLDEPFTSLDPALAQRMLELLGNYWRVRRPAVVMVTHDPAEAAVLATRVIVLDPQAAGPVLDEVLALPEPGRRSSAERNAVVARLRAVCPALDAVEPAAG